MNAVTKFELLFAKKKPVLEAGVRGDKITYKFSGFKIDVLKNDSVLHPFSGEINFQLALHSGDIVRNGFGTAYYRYHQSGRWDFSSVEWSLNIDVKSLTEDEKVRSYLESVFK